MRDRTVSCGERIARFPLKGDVRMKSIRILATAACLAALTLAPLANSQNVGRDRRDDRAEARLAREVRHELVMLPYYGVFDNLMFRVEGDTVRVMGQVTRPTLKSDAEAVVKDIEGVRTVINQIEV